MFTLDDFTFDINFRNGVEITMGGKENTPVMIQIFEYLKNESNPRILASFNLMSGQTQTFLKNWYSNYEINISKWDDEFGLIHLKKISYDERNQNILFVADPIDDEELLVWEGVINKLHIERGIIPTIILKNEDFIESDYYKIYKVGRNVKTSSGLQSGWPAFIWATWRNFWSWDNPRDWSNLTSKEIIEDIVGITENDVAFDGFVTKSYYL